MFTAEKFRAKAAESAESAKITDVPSEIHKHQRLTDSFRLLAQNEDHLADNFEKMIRVRNVPPGDEVVGKRLDGKSFAEIEEHVLRCPGRGRHHAVEHDPVELQRDLFDTAGSLGDVVKTVMLRGQIARFLHRHKDED